MIYLVVALLLQDCCALRASINEEEDNTAFTFGGDPGTAVLPTIPFERSEIPEILNLIHVGSHRKWMNTSLSRDAYVPPLEYIQQVKTKDAFGVQYDIWKIQNSESWYSERKVALSGNPRGQIDPIYFSSDFNMHLTHYPLGKNLPMMGLRLGTLLPHKGILKSGVVASSLIPGLKRDPWSWSRIRECQLDNIESGLDNVEKSWGCYFQYLDERPRPPRDTTNKYKLTQLTSMNLRKGFWAGTNRGKLSGAYLAAQSTWYAFQFNKHTRLVVDEALAEIPWPTDGKAVIASIHLQRGDVAGFNCSTSYHNFTTCDTIHDKLKQLELYKEFGVTHVYLSTQDPREVSYAREIAPQYTWISAAEAPSRPKKRFLGDCDEGIEVCLLKKSKMEDLDNFDDTRLKDEMTYLLVDFELSSRAHINILEMNSCNSLSIFLLSYGRKGYIPPHTPSQYIHERLQMCGSMPSDTYTDPSIKPVFPYYPDFSAENETVNTEFERATNQTTLDTVTGGSNLGSRNLDEIERLANQTTHNTTVEDAKLGGEYLANRTAVNNTMDDSKLGGRNLVEIERLANHTAANITMDESKLGGGNHTALNLTKIDTEFGSSKENDKTEQITDNTRFFITSPQLEESLIAVS